jgi:hypothetical protein
MPSMPIEVQREASLSLREPSGIVRVRVAWPPVGGDRVPVLVFMCALDSSTEALDAICRRLSADPGLVVLSIRTEAQDAAITALEWTADHATQLGADPGTLLVGGLGAGAGLATAVALHARHEGWPGLTRQVLIRPQLGELPDALAGLAPATVVGARRCAARLREAGVEVQELQLIGDLGPALRRSMSLERTRGLRNQP